jgi:hypothetical protein
MLFFCEDFSSSAPPRLCVKIPFGCGSAGLGKSVVKIVARFRPRLIAAAGLFFMVAACNRAPSAAQDPQTAADEFFASLEKGDPHAAYDGAAFGFQAAQTFAGFLSNAQALGLIGGHPPLWTGKEVHDGEARLEGTVLTPSGRIVNVSVTMTADGKAWKLFSLQTAMGSQEAENHFTLVGKGVQFNDVYHQPMPPPRQIDDLVHQTMARFNTAIQQGDFQAFYNSLSQQWRNGQRLSGEEAAGVTANMLKNHFQPFIDKKIDLSNLAGLQPVYDQPPLINEEGLLELVGHFNTPGYRVNFNLDYAYELPWWKLFGINVSLTN